MISNVGNWTQLNRTKLAVGLCTGVLALTACQSPTDSPPDKTVGTEYRQFERQPSERDVPDVELHDDALIGLDDHYFRHLGVHDSTNFYMARTNHENTTAQGLCFLAVEDSENTAESDCRGPDELDNMVLRLNVTSDSEPVEAFLIPDETQLDLPEGWDRVRDNVVIVTDPQHAPEEVEGQLPGAADWEDFTLQRQSN